LFFLIKTTQLSGFSSGMKGACVSKKDALFNDLADEFRERKLSCSLEVEVNYIAQVRNVNQS
jgi:hypothetical protein